MPIHIKVEEQEPEWTGICHHPGCLKRARVSLSLPKKHWYSTVSVLAHSDHWACLCHCEDFWKFSHCSFFKGVISHQLHRDMEMSVPQGVVIEKDITHVLGEVYMLCDIYIISTCLWRWQVIVFQFLALSIILFLLFPCSSVAFIQTSLHYNMGLFLTVCSILVSFLMGPGSGIGWRPLSVHSWKTTDLWTPAQYMMRSQGNSSCSS